MRILHFCNYADRVGGAEVYAHSLIEALRERRHEVALFGASPEGERDEPGLRVVRRPLFDRARLVRDPDVLSAWTDFVRRFRPDVLHVHNLFSVALEVVQALGASGIPLVHTVHDFQLLCPNSWCTRGDGSPCPGGAGQQCFEHGCERNYPYDAWSVLLSAVRQELACSAATIAVCPSAYLAERLRAHGWPEVRELRYFIDFIPAPPTPREGHELLYVGRLEREKGVNVVLDAMPEILRAFPSARLTILGGGSQANALADQARRLQLAGVVRFSSQVRREQLPEHYARATACILPSLWTENSPLVAYECLVSGLPMIGSRRGGIPELVEPDCGLTFEPGSPSDLARSTIELLRRSPAERATMAAAGRARARTHDKGTHVATIESLYREATDRGRPRPTGREAELLPMLAELERERTHAPGARTLDMVRGLARRLGLPKVLPG